MELIPGLQDGDDVGRPVPGLAVHGFVHRGIERLPFGLDLQEPDAF